MMNFLVGLLKKYSFKTYRKVYIPYFNRSHFSLWRKPAEKPVIIAMWDGHELRAGLADRLKGIITGFALAEMKNCEFRLHFTQPFQMEDYMAPNTYDWRVRPGDLKWGPFGTLFVWHWNKKIPFNGTVDKVLRSRNKKIFWYANDNMLKVMFPEKTEEELNAYWSELFHRLFKPSPALAAEIAKVGPKIDPPKVAFHFRFENLLGDFRDDKMRTLIPASQEESMELCYAKLLEVCREKGIRSAYCFSDSARFIDLVKERKEPDVDFVILDGPIKHLTYANGAEQTKTFIDFYFMSTVETVYLIKTDLMYHSVFSYYACVAGNGKFVLVPIDYPGILAQS
jgi:hypothetical protein